MGWSDYMIYLSKEVNQVTQEAASLVLLIYNSYI